MSKLVAVLVLALGATLITSFTRPTMAVAAMPDMLITLSPMVLADAPADQTGQPTVHHSTWGAVKVRYRGPNNSSVSQSTVESDTRKQGVVGLLAVSWPMSYKSLSVPWICQAGSSCELANSHRCGYATSVMLGGYYRGYPVSNWALDDVGKWLAQVVSGKLDDGKYNTPCGSDTYFSGDNPLGRLLNRYYGFGYQIQYGSSSSDITKVLYGIYLGHPVLVGVRISGGDLVSSGGSAHWVLAVGFDQANNQIILNDPGTDRNVRRGDHIRYSLSTFDASWSTSGRMYVSIWPQ